MINEEINADKEIDPGNLAGLLDDQKADRNCAKEEQSQKNQDNPSVVDSKINDQNDLEDEDYFSEQGSIVVPELMSDKEARPSQNVGPPARYDTSTGGSYSQKKREHCDDLITQGSDDSNNSLQYESGEEKVVVHILQQLRYK